MNQQKVSENVIGLLDAHLKAVVDVLIEDGVVLRDDIATISGASEKFLNGVAAELLEVELTPLLKIIRPDRYNKAIAARRNRAKRNGPKRQRRKKVAERHEEAQSVPIPEFDIPESEYPRLGDLFGD